MKKGEGSMAVEATPCREGARVETRWERGQGQGGEHSLALGQVMIALEASVYCFFFVH